jgi:hypothetical protein
MRARYSSGAVRASATRGRTSAYCPRVVAALSCGRNVAPSSSCASAAARARARRRSRRTRSPSDISSAVGARRAAARGEMDGRKGKLAGPAAGCAPGLAGPAAGAAPRVARARDAPAPPWELPGLVSCCSMRSRKGAAPGLAWPPGLAGAAAPGHAPCSGSASGGTRGGDALARALRSRSTRSEAAEIWRWLGKRGGRVGWETGLGPRSLQPTHAAATRARAPFPQPSRAAP